MSDSNVMTAPAVQDEAPVQDAPPLGFQELQAAIKKALADYKRREAGLADIRQALTKARHEEGDALQRSRTASDHKLIEKISRARIRIEVESRRVTVAEQSRGSGLETIAGPMRALQAWIVRQLANLKAERTRAHCDVLARELDLESLDAYCCRAGYPRDLLWRLAAISPDVIALDPNFPIPGLGRPWESGADFGTTRERHRAVLWRPREV